MTSYIDRLRSAPLADLEATATRAIRNAIAIEHAAGRSTVGQDASGRLVRTSPDGRETPLDTAKEPTKQSKTVQAYRLEMAAPSRRAQVYLTPRRAAARVAAAAVVKAAKKGKELRGAIKGALSKEPAKSTPDRKRHKGLDR